MKRFLCASLSVVAILLFAESAAAGTTDRHPNSPQASTFEVWLEGFEENPAVDRIGYVRMVIDLDGSSPWQLISAGIGGACSGWHESTGSGFTDGPSVFMSAHDVRAASTRLYVDYPLGDGMLFWLDCTAPVIGIHQIYFWRAPDIGDWDANEYPTQVQLAELTASRAVFRTTSVAQGAASWTRIKSLYR